MQLEISVMKLKLLILSYYLFHNIIIVEVVFCMHDAWFLEVAQHQLVFLYLVWKKWSQIVKFAIVLAVE